MGPPTKRKPNRRRWSSQLGFLFFAVLFLTLSIQRNTVNADGEEAVSFDPSSTVAPNTSVTSVAPNITGES